MNVTFVVHHLKLFQHLKDHFSNHQDQNKDPSNESEDDDPLMQKAN